MQPDQLIAKFQQKDESAFAELYERYSENILGVIHSILHDQELSEEVLQDVFVKAWNNASSYNSKKGRFFTWLLNIARNAAIDKTRSKAFKDSKQNQSAAFFVDILEDKNNFSSKVDAIGIKKYIEVLEPICKKVIQLLFFKGYTQKETAEELDIPLGTVKTRNRICINKLREVLGVT
ncbi:RNA polymerase sigma factor SigK [Dokdonia pacifica]|uniref:RNA polymerase sigma factor n=1 Tax=Dokdonia pacifica TaxID=1627892 RepID=A0A239C7T9_9FLAO|nr:sigma-70 family RNA polymerase sigma factor [Dokdonia pacifica]GGG26478.1 RNA polymerase sigma factor SigK [Dokdonia pacifica]SNS15514.1 RNA polymerase sigma-70 factor, ECF subfamily [Dokdonia pacifica]